MEQFKFDEHGQDVIINLFKNNKIVPIFGAGISKGLETLHGKTVPSGKELKNHMISEIINKDPSLQDERKTMENDVFSHVAQIFERKFPDPNEDSVKNYFFDHFTHVKIIDESLKRFLNQIDWEYVYTLNIDNAIEETEKGEWEIFPPASRFDSRLTSGSKRLYKIHGDVSSFLKQLDYETMIFTEEQYIKSLKNNKGFHDCLRSDCENKSLIYIGCSLDDELDIKYSILDNQKDMQSVGDNYRIYVSQGKLSSYTKERLETFRITHYIELESENDFSELYDVFYDCYMKSQVGNKGIAAYYSYSRPVFIEKSSKKNIEYLTCISSDKVELPYYFVKRDEDNLNKLVVDRLNVLAGRRFSGKTMLAISLLEYYSAKARYYIPSVVSVDIELAKALLELANTLVVFDSNSLDDTILQYLIDNINPKNNSYICVVMNTFDSIFDLVAYNSRKVNEFTSDRCQKGYLSVNETERLNEKLNKLEIAKFSDKSNILDNTMRIAEAYGEFENISKKYIFNEIEELQMFIWLLVKRKMYYEDMIVLSINSKYEGIVSKFQPFIQIEQRRQGETAKHSTVKVIANGRIGMLQLLGDYIYPSNESDVSTTLAKNNQERICEAIYQILKSYENVNKSMVKEFIMVDVLNDVFSRVYSKKNIDRLSDKNSKKNKYKLSGAAKIISRIYKYEPIQELKADDPNYWLQRAKSIYIAANTSQKLEIEELYDAVKWSKKAEQDAVLLIEKGASSYWRTKSNAEVETAMLYGKIAYKEQYSNRDSVNNALNCFYKAFNDANNQDAIEGIIERSKGAKDFKNLMNYAVEHIDIVDEDTKECLDYLLTWQINNG